MGFADRDYVKEKAKQAQDEQLHRRSHTDDGDAGAHRAYRPRDPWRESNYSGSRSKGLSGRQRHTLAKLILAIGMLFAFQTQWFADFITKWSESTTQKIMAPMTNGLVAKAKEAQDRLKAQAPATPTPPPPKHATLDQRLSAPYIAPMPDSTGYPGMEQQVVMAGNVSFTLKNNLPAHIYARMFYIVGDSEIPVREFYVLAHESITLNRLNDGNYLFRYKDLSSGDSFVTPLTPVGRDGKLNHTSGEIRVALSKLDSNTRRITDAELNSAGK